MSRPYELDDTDRRIINLLVKDAKLPYSEIARQLHVSGGTIHVRMTRLEELGIVRGATLDLDLQKVGYGIEAFLGIFLLKSSYCDGVIAKLRDIPEVVSVHFTTGSYNLFARLACRNTQHLRNVLHDQVQHIEGVERTETLISLEEVFSRPVQLEEAPAAAVAG
ncbi:MAG TPA: Lrp/AsnC ligand binding domain-containing protein [Hymenobacter sp.]|uniref:Lrp/AsnC ligand binding domain-containing protein n=1 Tax=Hymenobacter sp. TaxID=1898978 RepID=UPI002D7E3D9C|nr:Lrp/AsnC ligand binding domain-containing protein [Hymenobacter sp.]HET9504980.1 Lrp/AsnC ligand binding domain-containing protein [Hymenobacter sp.]